MKATLQKTKQNEAKSAKYGSLFRILGGIQSKFEGNILQRIHT